MKAGTKQKRTRIFPLTATAAMIALSIILCRYLGYSPQNTAFRFEIGFLPIAFVAYLFGPIYASVGYFIADVIGSLVAGYAPNFWISGTQVLFGAAMGLFLYKKRPSLPRIAICFSFIAIFIDVIAKSPIFVFMYGWNWDFTIYSRLINAAINLPIRIVTFYLLLKATQKPMDKIKS